MTTTLRQAINRLLADEELEAFVRGRRDTGVSWRRVALDVYDITGIAVTHETLRSWFPDPVEAAS